ncbi:peroxisomal membrane protein 4 isoform X1 [Ictidomys tridecemlineatus]|uniref:peroxisomal membrane protein 4 isoform X1 n=1 Tax=Ictidomys tridecemlineatus TaxID=43179 RepID=UPI00038BED43|nr:peroxisomal membrane protein 4 isoform X1 [Ictidomys tridecemlineatus]KAG3263104.1 peroxisomal membrane protein 4, transcript variant X1 [Ictidomys tridecemlineatus]
MGTECGGIPCVGVRDQVAVVKAQSVERVATSICPELLPLSSSPSGVSTCVIGNCPWSSWAHSHGSSLCPCSLRDKLRAILQATYTHSRNLACFVFVYKGLCALQSHTQGKTYQSHPFLAAFIGGFLIFGDNSNINSQINMYLTSRVLFALCRLGVEKGYIPELRWDPFPLYTAVVWGLVLWLFEYHRPTLQPSLQSSMTYLYEDSNVWHDLSDFLIYNKRRASK